MLSKEEANKLSKAAEIKAVEALINSASAKMEYSTETLNLTKYQQDLIREAGYKLDHTANMNGYLWRINWE